MKYVIVYNKSKTARRGRVTLVYRMINRDDSARKTYILVLIRANCSIMERLYRTTLLALYQLTLLVGIALMPLALVTQRFGVRLPIDRAVLSLKEAYETTQ